MNIILLLLSILGFGANNAPTHDLRKKESFKLEEWVQKNLYFIVLASMIVFVLVCSWSVGLCAVESGLFRNFIAGGV